MSVIGGNTFKGRGAGRDDSMLASVALSQTCLLGTRAESR